MSKSSANSYEIEIALYHKNHSCEPMIPRYAPDDWFECDFLAVTKADYAREFEIKTSHADFLKDFEKRATRCRHGRWSAKAENKHDRLKSGDCVPNYYWFVCPPGVIDLSEVPDYAGLMHAVKDKHGTVRLFEQKPAPRLHGNKLDQWVLSHISRSFFFRYWGAELKLMEVKNRDRRPQLTTAEKVRNRYTSRSIKIGKLESDLGSKVDSIRDYFRQEPEGDGWEKRRKKRRRRARDEKWKDDSWYRDVIRRNIGEVREGRRRLKRLLQLQGKDSKMMEEKDIGRY